MNSETFFTKFQKVISCYTAKFDLKGYIEGHFLEFCEKVSRFLPILIKANANIVKRQTFIK